MRAAGLQFEASERPRESEALAGKRIVVSGRFSRSRDEMKELIERHGGKNLAAVSGSVDFIVAGAEMGPAKLRKAEKLGIRILSEEEFMAMIEEHGKDAPAGSDSGTGAPEPPAGTAPEKEGPEASVGRTAEAGAPEVPDGKDSEVRQGELF